jgi:hypothetical protein
MLKSQFADKDTIFMRIMLYFCTFFATYGQIYGSLVKLSGDFCIQKSCCFLCKGSTVDNENDKQVNKK